MAWSNKSDRERLVVEKSHSFSLSVRIEDRMHVNIVQATDKLYFTVRNEEYKVGLVDTDALVTVEATQITSPELGRYFRVDVQADKLNLDPELEYWYDVTYVRDGYSLSLQAGGFEVAANVTNRGAGDTFTGGTGVFGMVATIQDRNVLVVQNTIPMPEKGATGLGTYQTSSALSNIPGNTVTIPISSISLYGRNPQLGDIIFSTETKGIMGWISAINAPNVTVTTAQVYGQEAQKAILDLVSRPIGWITLDAENTIPKVEAPLPTGYAYSTSDLLFSKVVESGGYRNYLVVSKIIGTTSTTLTVKTKIVFPMFVDEASIADVLIGKVDKTQTINAKALSGNVSLSADDIPAGATHTTLTLAEQVKLSGIAPNATANQTDAYLRDRNNHTGVQATNTVLGLETALNARPTSSSVSVIWTGTQAEYDLISPKLNSTLYFIKA